MVTFIISNNSRVSLSSVWLHKEGREVPRNFGNQTICYDEKTAVQAV